MRISDSLTENIACNFEALRLTDKAINTCYYKGGEFDVKYTLTKKIIKNSKLNDNGKIVDGNKTILHLIMMSEVLGDVEITAYTSLKVIFSPEANIVNGMKYNVPSSEVKAVGIIDAPMDGLHKYENIEGAIKVIEKTEKIVCLEIIDSLYSDGSSANTEHIKSSFAVYGKIKFIYD